jgi:uncharacterized protein (DUF1499 family)
VTSSPSLPPCPRSPNCVSSLAADPLQHVEPFAFEGDPEKAWARLAAVLARWPRTRILEDDGAQLHAECTTRVLRFRDDLHAVLDTAGSQIHLRSASRVGWSDLGANRRRVELLRAGWEASA